MHTKIVSQDSLRTYSTAQVVEMTGIPKSTISKAVSAGELRPATTSRVWRFRLAEISRWLDSVERAS